MFTLLAAALLATAFDADMSVQEMRETGVAKLSAKEKLALGSWLESRYSKKTIAANTNATPKNTPAIIEENLKSGRFIRLSDRSLWEINPSDTPITQGWITPVEIKVDRDSDNANYPYTLTNSLTGSSVRARKVQSISEQPSAPAKVPVQKKS